MRPSPETVRLTDAIAETCAAGRRMFAGFSRARTERLFADVDTLFAGRHPGYQAIDVRYHDLEHTLQATLCLVRLLDGRHATGAAPILQSRQFECALAAALLHDSGYLKSRDDRDGTGAKYTSVHVQRSCAFAAGYLPTVGFDDGEVADALAAIRCTGLNVDIAQLRFRGETARLIGCALTTADYLGQMAAPDYVDKLPVLFAEFRESDDFAGLPAAQRIFRSAEDLIAKTPAFWEKFVRPKLDRDFQGLYRFLASPHPAGPNPYLLAIEANLARIRR